MSAPADTAGASRLLRALAVAMAGPPAIPPGSHLLVATSGGPDSTALLLGLHELAPRAGWRLTAAHVDHGLRGAASRADRAVVERLAAALGVTCVVEQLAVPPGAGLEARARQARLRALVGLAVRTGASHIVLGHTADDQAETVLLRLLRGAGRAGLGGMRRRRGRLLRPLLNATRADVRRFLAERGVQAALDWTNANLRHARNRMRRVVLPLLAAEFNPALVPALATLALRLRDEDDYLAACAAARGRDLVDGRRLAVAVADEPPAIGRRVVRAWLEAGARPTMHARHVERVLGLARRPRGGGDVMLPGGWRVRREADWLVRACREPQAARPFHLTMAPGQGVEDPDGRWRLTLGPPEPLPPGGAVPGDARQAVFDADALAHAVVLRSRRPGDRVHLPGVGTRKLQDVLVDAKVPRAARDGVPLLEVAGSIVWVAGVVRAAGARIGPATRRIVRGTLEATGS